MPSAGFTIPESFVCQSHGVHPLQTGGGTVNSQAIAWEINMLLLKISISLFGRGWLTIHSSRPAKGVSEYQD